MYLSLQPYKQTSLKRNGAEKLNPRYYGPYKVIQKIGEVAYESELLEGSKIHNVFHVDVFSTLECIQLYILCIIPQCLFLEVYVMQLSHVMPQCSYQEI